MKLQALLERVEDNASDLHPLPLSGIAMLRANFGPRVLWSQCELWIRLLPNNTQRILQEYGGVLCPRNFLVNLATAALSPHELDDVYLAYRQGGRLFVGTLAADGSFPNNDVLRQGRHLEAALVSFGWLEEDRVLTELTLPGGLMAWYAGAPDALEGERDAAAAPLEAGDEAAYAAAGYELSETACAALGQPGLRIWRARDRAPAEPGSYVEVKKTVRLEAGWKGDYKRAKYWAQAALVGCSSVLVATTDGSDDSETVSSVRQFSADDLMAGIRDPAAMWGGLKEHLEHIMFKTASSDGPWTLRLNKSRRGRAWVDVYPGWAGPDHLHDMTHVACTEQALAENASAPPDDAGRWEMQTGCRWCSWNPADVFFTGQPGEIVHFRIGEHEYCAVFGPQQGEGFQENLATGRRRQLRFASTDVASICRGTCMDAAHDYPPGCRFQCSEAARTGASASNL